MSGNRAFDAERVVAVADYITEQAGPMSSVRLAILIWKADFDAYRNLGESLTGATWCKGTWERPVFVRELGEDWFRRYVRARTPIWVRAASWALTAWATYRVARTAG